MSPPIITASALVDLGASTDTARHLSVQLDGRPDGLNGGRSQFVSPIVRETDAPAFLVWSAGVEVLLQAIGGRLIPLGDHPGIEQEEEESVVVHLPPGGVLHEQPLRRPALRLPQWTPDGGAASVIEGGLRSPDGWWLSVRLRLAIGAPAPWGAWLAGQLRWRSAARAARVLPAADATRVILTATGRPLLS